MAKSLGVINDYTITEIVDLEAYLLNSSMLDFRLEELQEMKIDGSQDTSEITGRNGSVIGRKKKNKKLSGSGTNGLISSGLLKTQTGGELTNGLYNIKKAEVHTVKGATLMTDEQAVGTPGAEIGYLREYYFKGAFVATYEQATTADDTHFAYDPSTKIITLPKKDDASVVIADGTKVVIAYERSYEATKVTDPSDKYSEKRELWLHCFGEDVCHNEYYIAVHIPVADFNGEFSFDFGGDQTVHDFSFEALPDLCAKSMGQATDLFDLFVYGKNAGENVSVAQIKDGDLHV